MDILNSLVKGTLVPSMVTAGLLIGENFVYKGPLRQGSHLMALFFGFVTGFLLIVGHVTFPPSDATHWIFWLALIGAIWPFGLRVGNKNLTLGNGLRVARIIRWLALACVTAGLLRPLILGEWSAMQSAVEVTPLALVFTILWDMNERGIKPESMPGMLSGWLAVLTALSFFMVFSGSALMGQLVGLLCSVVGVAWVWSLIFPKRPVNPHIVGMVIFLLLGYTINAYYYMEANAFRLIHVLLPLMFIGPLTHFLFARGFSRWSVAAIQMVLSAAISGSGVYLAYQSY